MDTQYFSLLLTLLDKACGLGETRVMNLKIQLMVVQFRGE